MRPMVFKMKIMRQIENENNFDIIKIGNIPSLTSEMKNWKIKIFLDGATQKCQSPIPLGYTILRFSAQSFIIIYISLHCLDIRSDAISNKRG